LDVTAQLPEIKFLQFNRIDPYLAFITKKSRKETWRGIMPIGALCCVMCTHIKAARAWGTIGAKIPKTLRIPWQRVLQLSPSDDPRGLNASADPNDAIRTLGLRSASLIAKTLSKSSPQLILTPYFKCTRKENWRDRLGEVNFLKDFVMAITETTEADNRELIGKLEVATNLWSQTVPGTGQFGRANMHLFLERLRSFRSVGAHRRLRTPPGVVQGAAAVCGQEQFSSKLSPVTSSTGSTGYQRQPGERRRDSC
jgi:hypothetical protein